MCGSRIAVIPLVFTIEESADIRPNISGGIQKTDLNGADQFSGEIYTSKITATGPFSLVSGKSQGVLDQETFNDTFVGFQFNSNISSEIYGGSETIQPTSGYSLIIIKV